MPGGIGDAQQYCCAMERQWHMLFGEPPVLPGKNIAQQAGTYLHKMMKSLREVWQFEMYRSNSTSVNRSAEDDAPIAVNNNNDMRGGAKPLDLFQEHTGHAFTTDKKTVNKNLSYALVVVACKAGMDWLLDVPKEWRVVVFEKCGPTINASMRINASTNATMLSLLSHVEFRAIENVGAEECNGYLDYIMDFYHNLTDVTVFMHDDGLIPYNKRTDDVAKHSPFYNFSQVAEATQRFLTPSNGSLDKQSTTMQRGFLHFGIRSIKEDFGKAIYHGKAQQALWPFYATQENPKPPQTLTFKPSANMAVRKERILLRTWDVYRGLKRQLYYSRHVMPDGIGDARQYCCAMERQWHMLFGEPPVLPGNSMVTDLLYRDAKTKPV
jgi:hypothetical protein